MKIIKVAVQTTPEVIEIDGSLESMQEIVGGLIQIYYIGNDDNIVVICNEEGKLNGSLPNRVVLDEDGEIEDIIFGDFFLCSAPPDSEDLESVPDELIDEYISRFSF